MKIQLEKIGSSEERSFYLLHHPRLNDLFYWHFHPEYELVYIEGASGTRHVGTHISPYKESDLVLIGSNIPHLNFDYGVKSDYKKEVLHLKPNFKNKVFKEMPEFSKIYELLERSQHGLVFHGNTKADIGKRIQELFGMPTFQQFLEVLHILSILADSEEYQLLHPDPVINNYSKKEQERLGKVYAFVDDNYQHKISLDQVAHLCNLEKSAFCRYFKKATGNTFIHFLNQYRISRAKRLLLMGKNVSETCFESGFESLSYFNRIFKKLTDQNPSDFKRNIQKTTM
ncbi:HTH-type transcriptional activator RhaS [Arenibacter antarcticus]|uniref:AraC family transcriptional regulator n=1 Tax=Arenibacter antarcticus TaxID=2040469 RepID=A0ABW5VHY1_9FLAO|nr:AraC family transcriptional regulator [Arenibacter sp. H213]MCM4166692.1 AraC family transcriptional regulator [Arenibacter sp. H213]